MRETIDRILEGKFDYDKGSLDFSCSRIEISMPKGEIYTGSFKILSAPGHLSEGYIYSTDIRMHLITDTFSGTSEEIGYSFSTKGLEEGDVVKGDIFVISNQGEYYLPYVVSVEHSSLETSLGSIRNLFHFANLAKTNWDEAVKLFYNDEFVRLFQGNDRQYYKAYLGLSHFYGNEQNVEEFLLEINKKNPTEYIVEKETVVIDEPYGDVEEYADITRNGWGYTFLNVSCDSDFVVLSKTSLTDSDFLGNYIHYSFIVKNDKLHDGNNYATIHFYNSFVRFSVNVKVLRNAALATELSRELDRQRSYMDMVTYFQAFRMKRIATDTWIAETNRIVERMLSVDAEDYVAQLFKAQLLITEDRRNEAKWILDQVESYYLSRQDYQSPNWAYYLYVTTLYNREEAYIDQITDEVENIYNRDPSQWKVAWLLLYLSPEYAVSPTRKWLFILKQLELNCLSPIMYVEAANMLLAEPQLLTKLDPVELRVLTYMSKYDMVTGEVLRQFVYLAGTGKWNSEGIHRILIKCYEVNPSMEIVETLCKLFIQLDKKGEPYKKWYRLAIENELRVTRIYEYYMMSIDLSRTEELPKMVFLYFSYENDLDWKHTAYLYARILEAKETYPELFETYKDHIIRFVLTEIAARHMGRDHAALYRYALGQISVSEDLADKLVSLIFTHRITVESDLVSKVIVYQSREKIEEAYPIEDHEAYVPLYNKDYTILLEDNFSNRYMPSVPYELEKLMVPGKLANLALPFVHDNLPFDVYACECSSEMVDITDENRDRYQHILDSIEIDDDYKVEIRAKLMQYYYDNDCIRELDLLLEGLTPEEMSSRERNICIRFLVMRGMFDKAIEWILTYGLEGLEAKDLVKLCSRLISRSDFIPSKELTAVSYFMFKRGKYDEIILSYLADNFHGMTKEMRLIFKASMNFDINVRGMCENLLVQMMYTGYYVPERLDIYRKYISLGASSEVQVAFLTMCAYEFFVKEQIMEAFVFEELTKLALQGEKLQTVSKLAYVKFYSENKDLVSDVEEGLIDAFLPDLLNQGIYMSFFKEFMEQGLAEINRFSDKTIIEYKTDPGKKVFIHYIIEQNEDLPGEYITSEMRDMFGGVHARSFVLFFGENLQYYITEESEKGEMLTESGTVTKSDISRDISQSRFSEINDIVISATLQDYDTAEHLIYEYERKEHLVNKLFTLR